MAHLLAALSAVLAACSLSVGAHAQTINPLDIEPDPNGVDLVTGAVMGDMPTLSIPAAPELAFRKLDDFFPLLEGKVPAAGTTDDVSYKINAGGIASDGFSCFEGCAKNENGSVLDGGPTVGPFIYTQGGSAKKIRFDLKRGFTSAPAGNDVFFYVGTQVETPGAPTLTFTYEQRNNPLGGVTFWELRPTTVTSTSGYQLKFTYQGGSSDPIYLWKRLDKVEIVAVAAPTVPLASLQYGSNGTYGTITEIDGRVYQCSGCAQSVTGENPGTSLGTRLILPTTTTPTFDAVCTQPGFAGCGNPADYNWAITRDGVVYNYAVTHDGFVGDDAPERFVITGPEGFYRRIEIERFVPPGATLVDARRRVKSITNSENETTTYTYDPDRNAHWSRVISIATPGGRTTSVTYDQAANITSRTLTGSSGSITESATFSTSFECTSVTCFRPTSTTDGNGNTTTYVWSSAHGGLLEKLEPEDQNNKRRKTKNTYDGVGRLIKEEICEADLSGTELNCGTANSFVRTINYWNSTWLPASESVTDGVGTAPLTTTYAYDSAGRQTMVNPPHAGTDDASYVRYDNLGRKIWEIGPKGANDRRTASKYTYRTSDDQIVEVRTGTVAGTTTHASPSGDPPLLLITDTDTTYNLRRLAVKSTVRGSDNVIATASQTSYDALNRTDCTAVRMNPTVFGSLPSSACTLGTQGADGPDRITKTRYDTEGRVIQIKRGVGTGNEISEVMYSYTASGQIENVVDANGNRAQYTYDGHDRLTRWDFPNRTRPTNFNKNAASVAASGASTPSSTDYEAYTYDNNGNRLSLRKRDGSVISYTYDKRNRMTRKTIPARADLSSTHTRDVFYDYDVRDLQTKARFTSLGHGGNSYFYDRYGRLTAEWQSSDDGITRAVQSHYRGDGHRTQITHPDGLFWQYEYDGMGRVWRMREGTWIFGQVRYTDREQVREVDWSVGAASAHKRSFTYDSIGRLNSVQLDLHQTAHDVTWNYTRNPASQIRTEIESNASYSWDGHVNLTRNYTTNGLNQYTVAGSSNFTYDANGNLTSDGNRTFQYDVENRLVKVTGNGRTTDLYYDPTGRLYRIQDSQTGQTNFLYDGNAMIAEYNSGGGLVRRYVHGSNVDADDPLVVYEGSVVDSTTRRFLHADPRGSIVAITNQAGTSIATNTYDEYGIPDTASGNDLTTKGRFRYTGQMWIPELGMYYYKARFYSYKLGRFLQTDPIGYEDQFNLYAYVANDPINGTDFSGLEGNSIEEALSDVGRDAVLGCATDATCRNVVEALVLSLGARFDAEFEHRAPINVDTNVLINVLD